MPIKEKDLIVFGYGQMTELMIEAMIKQDKKVLCVTNNTHKQVKRSLIDKMEIYAVNELTQLEIISNATIFTWRNSGILQASNNNLINWIKSSRFATRKSCLLSSASVYKDSPTPVNESNQNLEAKVEFNSKYQLEMMLADLMKVKQSHHINLRISNVYGKNLDYGFIGSLLKSIELGTTVVLFEDQSITRDYIHVNDVVQAVQKLIQIDVYTGSLNVSSGVGTTISKVLEIFSNNGIEFKNFKIVPMFENYKKSSILNCNALSELIDWKPISVRSALNDMLAK